MARKREKPEDIISKLRQIEVLQGQGMTIVDAARQIGIAEQTFYRWRKQYDRLDACAWFHHSGVRKGNLVDCPSCGTAAIVLAMWKELEVDRFGWLRFQKRAFHQEPALSPASHAGVCVARVQRNHGILGQRFR